MCGVKERSCYGGGAIAESFMMSDINIENSKCLVTGYGRCGRVLAQKLLRMGAEVTVTARSVEACFKAAMGDCHTILLDQLGSDNKLDQFDFVIIPYLRLY